MGFKVNNAWMYSNITVHNFILLIEASLFTDHSPTAVLELYVFLLRQ